MRAHIAIWLTLSALTLTGLFSPPAIAEPAKLRIGTYVPERSVGVQSVLLPWMSAVEDEIGDEVSFTPFWGGSLGRNPYAQYELVRRGVLDLAWVLPGYTAGQFPQLGVVDLPFLASDAETASVALWEIYESGLADGFRDTVAITVWANDPSGLHMVANDRTLDDVAGLRFRTTSSEAAEWVEGIGAAPQTMSAIDMNQALQRGGIDGLLQGWTGMRTFGTLYFTNSLIDIPTGSIAFALLMNRDRWESLPRRVRDVMMKHGGAALARRSGAEYDRMAAEVMAATLAERDYRIIRPNAEQLEANRSLSLEMHRAWAERVRNGEQVLALFHDVIERLERE